MIENPGLFTYLRVQQFSDLAGTKCVRDCWSFILLWGLIHFSWDRIPQR